jgi:nicotinamide riboside transporter PnuC
MQEPQSKATTMDYLALLLLLFFTAIYLLYSFLWPWSAARRRSRREKEERLARANEQIRSRRFF